MNKIKEFLKDTYKIIIIYIIILIILLFPLPYFIYAPGGIINVSNRVDIKNSYKQKGSFNLSYVSEYKGNLLTIVVSLLNKNWDIISRKDNYEENISYDEYELRDQLMMKQAYVDATINAYKHANKEIKVKSKKVYVSYLFEKSKTDLKVGDQIIKINNIKIKNRKQINKMLNKLNIGDSILIEVINNNKIYQRKAKVIEYKKEKLIGIGIIELKDIKTNPKIKYNYKKDESGPSGGLMVSLNIYNSLIRNDITKGKTIVGTGTIDEYGNVGEISGVKYKIKGAIKKDIDLFIVPNKNLKEALKVKKDNNYKIKIIGVDTFDEVINYLNKH